MPVLAEVAGAARFTAKLTACSQTPEQKRAHGSPCHAARADRRSTHCSSPGVHMALKPRVMNHVCIFVMISESKKRTH